MTRITWPTGITIARIILVGPMIVCLINLNEGGLRMRYLTLGLVAVMALSDALDGYLARRLHQESAIGRFLDPVGDKLLITSAVIILAMPNCGVPGFILPAWVTVTAIGKDVATVIGFAAVKVTTGQFFIQPRFLGKATTTLQSMMLIAILLGPDLPGVLEALPRVLWWAASIVAVAALADYIRIGIRFVSRQGT